MRQIVLDTETTGLEPAQRGRSVAWFVDADGDWSERFTLQLPLRAGTRVSFRRVTASAEDLEDLARLFPDGPMPTHPAQPVALRRALCLVHHPLRRRPRPHRVRPPTS